MSVPNRPDPDELLRRVAEQERAARRGKLKIFLGAAPGVGNTYAMLSAARDDAEEDEDIVIGVIEHHGRRDTAALLLGLEILPRKKIEYRGTTLEELDLDGAIARKPGLLLVDELAHSNAEGCRHAKRWQDVEELLAAGVNVYTTLNVQHIESLNDVVAQITGVRVRETVPDAIVDKADDVAIIDLPPDELLERLQEGKVYVPAQAQRAMQNFFKKGNLIALRDLALRKTAERVEHQMDTFRKAEGIEKTWATHERILVCVSASPLSARLVRAARRMASSTHALLIAAYVETPLAPLGKVASGQLEQNLRLAESLDAETVRLMAPSGSAEVLRFAHERNVTRIVVGKPTHARWRDVLRGSFLDELVRGSGDIDISVVSGDPEGGGRRSERPGTAPNESEAKRAPTGSPYLLAAAAVGAASVIARLLVPVLELADLVMIYLVGIMFVSTRVGYGPSLFAVGLSIVSLDYLCVPPYLTLAVADLRHIMTFGVMLVVAVVMTTLTNRIRLHAVAATERERRAAALYAISRDLASTRGVGRLAQAAVTHIEQVFTARATVLIPQKDKRLAAPAKLERAPDVDAKEASVAQWVFDRRHVAGLGTQTLPASKGLYLPLLASRQCVGVLGVIPSSGDPFTQDQRALLETFANQTALAIERAQLASEAQEARLRAESEQIRNALLSSVSHDLRTPLTAIKGAASTLRQDGGQSPSEQRALLDMIHEEADRLNRLVTNLLEVTKLESGTLQINREWQPIEEVIGSALHHVEGALGPRPVSTDVPADLPLVAIDEVLVEQVLLNLLDNAIKYTPPGSPIDVAARKHDGGVLVEIADRGPGLGPGDEERIFDKFHRASPRGQGGSGLGLTICRGVVEAHGGRIWAESRAEGGAVFRFTLPSQGAPPPMPPESDAD